MSTGDLKRSASPLPDFLRIRPLRCSGLIAFGSALLFQPTESFGHVHPPYDGSMHMMLPPEVVNEVLAKGWGEPHPMVRRGLIPPTAVMVYAPRDAAEVEVILHMIGISYRFACGEGPAA